MENFNLYLIFREKNKVKSNLIFFFGQNFPDFLLNIKHNNYYHDHIIIFKTYISLVFVFRRNNVLKFKMC